jgi:hypothetical protein
MKKIIHCVYINDYFPELWSLTLPTIKDYAFRTKSELNIITQRKFSDWHINYEKMQVYEDGKHADCNFLIDADILIHPTFPDFSNGITFPHHIAFNDNYHASSKFNVSDNIYFQRDGRDVGIASNAVISFKSTHDVWQPLDITPDEGRKITFVREGDIDEYTLSVNMAKYGLKYTGITWEEWQRYYFVHLGCGDRELAIRTAHEILYNWKSK